MSDDAPKHAHPATPAPPNPKLSYEEFLNWEGANQHVEWVDGKVVYMSPLSKEHHHLRLFLLRLISDYVDSHHLGRVCFEPFQMKTGPKLPGRSPDIAFVATKHLPRLKRLYLDGPADLVVEVASKGSRAVDRGEKFFEYEQGGVPEYWFIDPHRKTAEFYVMGAHGIYDWVPVGQDGRYHSKTIEGLWIDTHWFWREPLPTILSILKEWKLI